MTALARTMSNPLRRAEVLTAYLFLSPTLIGFVVFIVGPVIAAVVLSTYNWNMINPAEPAGLNNYKQLLSDPRLGSIYLTTFKIAVSTVLLKLFLGLIIAVLLDTKIHTDVWKDLGFYVVVFVGGLQTISGDLYEAAEVDGSNRFQRFLYITLPLLTPTILFLSVIGLINAVQIFAQPWVLTMGGPGDATRTVVMYIFEQGFRFFNMGYASTVALSLFVVLFGLTILQFAFSRRWVFYQ